MRWLIRRDMPQVLHIEGQSFQSPWTDEDFLFYLCRDCHIGMVAEHQERIVGFMVYEIFRKQIHVLNFAVDPSRRRQSVGSQMVDVLVRKLFQQRREEIILEVRERNLPAQLFFRQQGFLACSVLRKYYSDTTEDAYEMIYRRGDIKDNFFGGRNRITQYEPIWWRC